jgi:hypothetical protein
VPSATGGKRYAQTKVPESLSLRSSYARLKPMMKVREREDEVRKKMLL